ncbi:uncharacterized protein PRCAT00003117001 [Priceomyces carsonii]|uniref:uncharacterized protein n=1 Tax=Priceomyces carsonii TaxID=28549 RepID=UPI002EDB3189|nr:unnamed protein product [Priceomyces carsonii]
MSSSDNLTGKLIFAIIIICLGAFQFGYHMAELNSPELIMSCRISKPERTPYADSFFGRHGFKQCIPLDPQQVGLVTSIFSIGGLIGSVYVGSIANKIGRKKTTLLYCVIFFVGSTLNGLSNNYASILIGRLIAGLGAGAALVITPVFIQEIAPVAFKGFLGTMNQVSVNVGILVTQGLALKWCTDNRWRLLLLSGSVLALLDFVLAAFYVDESPMWLFHNGHSNQAYISLHKLRGGDYTDSRNEVNSWSNEHSNNNSDVEGESLLREDGESVSSGEAAVTLETYLKSPEHKKSRIAGTGILVLQQFCGINSIIFYGVAVLTSIFPDHAIFVNCLISIVNVVVTFASASLVEKLGRKPLLLSSTFMMGVSTILMGIGIISASSVFSIIGMFTYIAFFAIGMGPIPFFLVGELTKPKAKATAQSWGTTMNWLATFIVGFLFPILKNSWIGGSVYFIFTGMCAVAYLFVKFYIPETKGKTSYDEVWGTEEGN